MVDLGGSRRGGLIERLRKALSSALAGRRRARGRSAWARRREVADDPVRRIDTARQRLRASIPPRED